MKFNSLYEATLKTVQPVTKELPYTVLRGGTIKWHRYGGNLEGAPEVVRGAFLCSGHELVSLKGGPRKVGGVFNCAANFLEDLEGAPEEVGGMFLCGDNPLKSLKGIPELPDPTDYFIPDEFTLRDVQKEIDARKLQQSLDPETKGTFGDFIAEL